MSGEVDVVRTLVSGLNVTRTTWLLNILSSDFLANKIFEGWSNIFSWITRNDNVMTEQQLNRTVAEMQVRMLGKICEAISLASSSEINDLSLMYPLDYDTLMGNPNYSMPNGTYSNDNMKALVKILTGFQMVGIVTGKQIGRAHV